MLDRIKGAVNDWLAEQQAHGQTKKNLKGYGEGLGFMFANMTLSPSEIAALEAQRRSLQLPPDDVRRVHLDVFTRMSKAVLEDGMVTLPELQALTQVGTVLGIGWNDLPPTHLKVYRIAHNCIEIQQGKLPQLPPGSTMIRELPGEVVHAEVPSKVLDEKVIAQEYVGRSSGTSLQISKGVDYHVGSSRGRSVPVTAIVPVDDGVFAITDRRVAFMGKNTSFSVDWANVLSAEPLSDGVRFSFATHTESVTLQYNDSTYAEVLSTLLGYYMS